MQISFIHPGKKRVQRSDEDLIQLFTTTGELEVLGELYSTYMHLVYGISLKYLKTRDESMDSVMQIFEKLITEIPKHNIQNFKSWLYVLTKNHCLMQLRSAKSNTERLNEWTNDTTIFMENSYVVHPIDEDEQHLDKSLADCIERLKNEQKDCIRQFYYENRCYNEIANRLSLDEKKVKSHLQNAKRNLKLCLEEKHVGQEQL